MKAIFKLKEIPWKYENQLSNEMAEKFYKEGRLPFNVAGWGFGDRRVSCGFFSRELTFYEWIDRYRLKII